MEDLSIDGANRVETVLTMTEKLIDWVESFCEWAEVHARTWADVERDFPTWETLDGTPWWQVQVSEATARQLRLPWEVHDPRYPREGSP